MINKLLQRGYFPLLFKIISLIAFIALMITGFSVNYRDPALLKQLRNTNIANLLVWSYW